MIDPAVLRPGRLDVKIRVDRPGHPAGTPRSSATSFDGQSVVTLNVDAKALIGVLVNDIYAQVSPASAPCRTSATTMASGVRCTSPTWCPARCSATP